MSKIPKHNKEAFNELSSEMLGGLIRGISLVFLILVFGLVFMLTGDHIKDMWSNFQRNIEIKRKPIIKFESQINNDLVDGIHQETGLAYGPGFSAVRKVCLSCHSSALIIQNKATAEGWDQMLTWMQRTQGLPALGNDRKVIVEYLAQYYGPIENGRRPNLPVDEIEWYVLDLE